MKVFEIRGAFGLENLVACDRPAPDIELGPGQILLRMSAVSLNFRDLLMVQGFYNPRQPLPLIPCSDGVGRVVAIGPDVTRVKIGDRVSPIFAQKWISGRPTKEKLTSALGGPIDGVLAEQMIVDAEAVVLVPEHLSDEEAATLPCAALTAWNALVWEGDVHAGDRVLVLGTGGVSIFALQFARLLGAEVIATSSSDEKLEQARALGAAHGINYRDEPKWGRRVKELTGGEGVDHVIEVGGAGTLEQSVKAVRIGGHISLIGVLSGGVQELNIIPIFMQNIRMQGIIVGHREMFEDMNRAIAQHQMRPLVERVFEFDETPQAFACLQNAAHMGKICIRL